MSGIGQSFEKGMSWTARTFGGGYAKDLSFVHRVIRRALRGISATMSITRGIVFLGDLLADDLGMRWRRPNKTAYKQEEEETWQSTERMTLW